MSQLLLIRDTFTSESTIGRLFINGNFICYTLEDVVRPDGVKIYGETAIPDGLYKVSCSMSRRFGIILPYVHSVPGFKGIRIHGGNRSEDTLGCILVGSKKGKDLIWGCKKPLETVISWLSNDKIHYLSIHNSG